MKKTVRTIIVAIVGVALIIGYYVYLTGKNNNGVENNTEELSAVQELLTTDFEEKYPATPREVIRVFNRFLNCFYNEELSENDIVNLANAQRIFLDEELLDNNPSTQYLQSMKADVQKNHEEKRTIRSASVCGSNEVIYKTVDSRKCAYVTCGYFMKVGKEFQSTTQRYVLRKDSEGKWKILVYYLIQNGEEE
ncbi:MAG: hypothetical protein K6A30_03525 [Lachnospiraceae bacterium]|nr:hypothetical protein [Lachnospiraceae bacterium]